MRSKESLLQNVALFIVLLFHISGAIGILFSPYRDWFVQNTPLNLILMSLLLIITQTQKNKAFFLFFLISYIVGFTVELIGVNTRALFGHYQYGTVLGWQHHGVPLLIGINWFIIIYCTGVISSKLYNWSDSKLTAAGTPLKPAMRFFSFITDGALLATFFDFVLEPVAVKLQYWQWLGDGIPLYNYACWFLISAFLLTIFKLLPFDKNNRLAVHLFIVQILFFLLLRISL